MLLVVTLKQVCLKLTINDIFMEEIKKIFLIFKSLILKTVYKVKTLVKGRDFSSDHHISRQKPFQNHRDDNLVHLTEF